MTAPAPEGLAAPAAPATPSPALGALRRVAAVARAEVLLLLRNRTLLLNATLLPVGVVVLLATNADSLASPQDTATALGLVTATLLLFVVYYNVLSTAVARRDAGVLQRLRTGELTDAEILTALCAPAVAVTLGQSVLLGALGTVALDLPAPRHVALIALALLLGSAVFGVLAYVTATWSRSLEAVQVTALPLISVCLLGAGTMVPLDVLPDALRRVAEVLPLTPVVGLLHAGWVGSPAAGDVLRDVGVLAAWTVAGSALVRLRFTWSPRA